MKGQLNMEMEMQILRESLINLEKLTSMDH